MKTYSAPSTDLWDTIKRMQETFHPDLLQVTVGALFVFDDEGGDQVLKHNGYFAAGVIAITPIKQRALGIADAIIIVDRACWLVMGAKQRDALIDHELQHLARVVSEPGPESKGGPVWDVLGRPKLTIRRHDHQFGWFDEIARRHGEASSEVRQAKDLIQTTQQLYFDFAAAKTPTPRALASIAVLQAGGWPKWSQDNQRFENRDGTAYEGPLDVVGDQDAGDAPTSKRTSS